MAFEQVSTKQGPGGRPNHTGAYRPPMWSSQLFGEPHGEWMKRDVVIDPVTLRKTVWDNADISNSRTVEIEMGIRELVEMRKATTEMGWEHLFGLLRVGDSGQRRRNGRIGIDMFRKILEKTFRRYNFSISPAETIALFMKYGHDEYGRMPYEMFSHRVFSGQAHQLSLEGCKKSAFDAKNPRDWTWQGMIKYPICRSGVFAPSDWEDYAVEECRRSACIGLQDRKPEAYLKLEHVYGYSSPKNVSPNLFYTKNDVVYYTAAVGIVYDDDNNRQKFFLRHDDDIQCLAIHPDKDTIATGQVGAEPICYIWSATSLKGPEGRPEPIMLTLPYGHRGIIVLGFNHDGNKLATVSTDNEHTVTIWNWRTGEKELNAAACQGIPPVVYGILWNPFKGQSGAHPCDFVTYGIKHINFWTLGGEAGLEAGAGSFDVCAQQDVLCACFLQTNHCLFGGPNGDISVFEDGMGILAHKAHEPGRVDEDDPNHQLREGGCTTIVRGEDGQVLSGGGDGKIILWAVKTEPTFALEKLKELFDSTKVDPDGPPRMFTGLDFETESKTVVAADSENDIWEIDDDPRVMVEGQSGDVGCVTPYPLEGMAHIYATASADGNVYLWDGDRRENIRSIEVRRLRDSTPKGCKKNDLLAARAVAFSFDGKFLAVTTSGVAGPSGWIHPDKGGVLQIWEAPGEGVDAMFKDDALQDEPFMHTVLFEVKDNEEGIDDVKFSPNGQYCATGSHDNFIDIYLIDDPDSGKWHRTGRCKGHSSYISHIDWDIDSRCIQANDAAYELLFWRPDGHQEVVNQRDTKWQTWTCTLGFWVMGMWQDGMCGNDINAVYRSHDAAGRGEQFLVAADDNGKVWLFNFPAVIEDAPGHAFKGHASHVQGICFSNDDRKVMSVGGHDRSLFQWKTHGITKPSRQFPNKEKRSRPKAAGGPGATDGPTAALKMELQLRELQYKLQKQNALMEEKNREIEKLTESLTDP